MEIRHDFSKCSVIYYHSNEKQARKLAEIFERHNFETMQPCNDLARLLGIGIARKPTFAFLGSDEWYVGLLDVALQLRKYAPQSHRILQLPVGTTHLLPLLEANANGYLCPQATDDEMLLCLSETLGGKCYLCDSIRQLLNGEPNSAQQPDAALLRKLTVREKQVLHLVASGLAAAEIADKLCLGYHTVKNHKSNIITKLGLGGRVELYMFAGRNKALFENTKAEK